MAQVDICSAVRRRHQICWSGRFSTLLLYGATLFLIFLPHCNAERPALMPHRDLITPTDRSICPSVDIRNTLDLFERLRGCRVVEGFVHILLFDNFNETHFEKLSFPELTEITDYLLLYRVNGLRTLGQLFPNLAVIRGQSLFFTYALVIYEMLSLQEIALYSLTDITNGLVRIDKNPVLCYVNSVDWNRITKTRGENFIKSLRNENECPLCPGDDTAQDKQEENLPKCPSLTKGDQQKHLCWNREHCQKICPTNCSACDDLGNCCDEKCLGGCPRDDRKGCLVCKNFTISSGSTPKCMEICPDNFYEFLGRRCIKEKECIAMRRPIRVQGPVMSERPYKIHNKTCVLTCPAGFIGNDQNHTCEPCGGRCKKECPGTNVDNLNSAQQLLGCTIITGSLEIQIRGGSNIVNELEKNLNMIEEIHGYLKVVRSFPLISLNFLKNLRIIHGNILESDKYAFVVLDNQNLQELWDWKGRSLTIEHGKLFFHFNPKLCMSVIDQLQNITNLPNYTEHEVASTSNGDKTACYLTQMEVNITSKSSKAVILNWEPFKMDDARKLLGYEVYTIEAPYKNVTLYDGRDACGGDGWRVDDVSVSEDRIHYLLTGLKPHTQYALYVKTFTIATYRYGAKSDILYFKTLPDRPSMLTSLKIKSNASDSFIVTWKPPEQPNGNITHYIITGIRSSRREMSSTRDYCKNLPAPSEVQQPPVLKEPIQPKLDTTAKTCSCDYGKKSATNANQKNIKKESEEEDKINFENALHNVVYIKKGADDGGNSRRRRDVDNQQFPNSANSDQSEVEIIRNITDNETWYSFNFTVYGRTELHISNLHHFTDYRINLTVCRAVETKEDANTSCSIPYERSRSTKEREGADDIKRIDVIRNQTSGAITFTWDEPRDPNGVILTYSLYIQAENSLESNGICINRAEYLANGSQYTLQQNLSPGNYSLRVRARSLAGYGGFSPFVYFYIEEQSSGSGTQFVIFGLLALLILAAAVVFYLRRRRTLHSPDMKLIASVNPEYVSTVYVPDEWEVPRRKIELHKELGQGSFGMVYEGVARDVGGKSSVRCAIKTVNEHATNRERIEFLNEASVMKAFDTSHVVRLLGVVSQGQPTLVVMELMANGDLKSYLRSHRPDAETYDPTAPRQPPTLKRILQMAIEIADGMAYLAAKKFVHRDLAARNCMVSEDLTVKIGDFGMTRDIYETDYYRKGTKGLLPVRWMAPESLKDGVFTSSSDVWSYGVVLWEMATLASQPYQGLSNDQVLRYVIDGGVMERPENCPDKLYTLMKRCWQHKPSARPSFLELCALLLEDACGDFTQVSFYHSAAGVEIRNSRATPTPSQDDPSTPLTENRDYSTEEEEEEEEESEQESSHDARIDFPNFSKDSTATVNGFVTGRPTNGTAASQC